jgi:hypothetical protein
LGAGQSEEGAAVGPGRGVGESDRRWVGRGVEDGEEVEVAGG